MSNIIMFAYMKCNTSLKKCNTSLNNKNQEVQKTPILLELAMKVQNSIKMTGGEGWLILNNISLIFVDI